MGMGIGFEEYRCSCVLSASDAEYVKNMFVLHPAMSFSSQNKETTKLQQKDTFLWFMFLILIQVVACDKPANLSSDKWTCRCSLDHKVNQSIMDASNCSASCNCQSSAGRSADNKWTCMCNDRFPLLAADSHNTNCFVDCNCTSGSSSPVKAPKVFISSKAVLVVLSVCVLFALALLALVICFVHQRVKLQPSGPLQDEGSSYNSGTNLISRKPKSLLESKLSICFPVSHISGYISKLLLPLKPKSGRLQSVIIQFSFSYLEHATNKFSNSNVIGVGASSHVYCGRLEDGRTVAVKRIATPEDYDADSAFLREIELISRLNHCHVVPLIGYCSESVGKQIERLLVFEFMPKGNLRECLDGSIGQHLDWRTRISIALGTAKGLEYLHEAAAPRILHRDVKSSNVLLDERWRPKITDLGMAKMLRTDGFASCSNSPARLQGTFGYFAPEYAILGKASLKSDVFSFGVVLLELITGRKPIYSLIGQGEESLVIWAAPRLQNSKQVLTELPDPRMGGDFPEEEMQVMAYLAKECLLLDADARPSMSEVVQILSTLAPDKSRRKLTSLFQNTPFYSLKANHNPVVAREPIDVRIDTEELGRPSPDAWSPRSPAPLDITHVCTFDNALKQGSFSSSEYVRTLIHLSSDSKTCERQNDEENVHLTEPRLESFCIHNVPSS